MRKYCKWLVALMTVVAMLFAFAACGGEEEQQPTGHTISDTEITLTVGQTKQLTVSPAAENVSWASANEAVVTVADGLVTALSEGTALVTATIGEEALSCTVHVEKEQVPPPGPVEEEYTLDLTSLSLKTGDSKQLTVLDKDGNTASGVAWKSEAPDIATVSSEGLVTAVAPGSTEVKATVGEQTLTCSVTVTQKYTYSLDKTSLDIAAGAVERITLVTTPEPEEDVRPHTFTSSNPAVATVEGGTGKVTGVAKGTATITCSVDGEELTATVTVTEYTLTVDGEAWGETLNIRMGEEKQITVTADPSTHAVEAVYASDDPQTVTVEGGHIVPVKTGTTTITVTVGGREFKTTVTVGAAVQYSINETEVTLKLGETKKLEVTADPAGSPFTLSFDVESEEIASVGDDGTITPHKVGTTTVTTTVVGTEFTFETQVNVVLDSSVSHKDFVRWTESVNLTYLDENKTLDWNKYAADGQTKLLKMKDSPNLIGAYEMQGCDDEAFWDYKAPIFFDDGEDASGVNTYGRAVHGSYKIEIKVTSAVSKIVLFTGSWKEAVTVQFKLGDAVLQEDSFTAGEDAVARMITLTLQTEGLEGELTLTVMVNCNRANGGNASIAAVAVIGKQSHGYTLSADASGEVIREPEGAQNVTEAGNLDWIAANGTRKADAEKVLDEEKIVYTPQKSTGNDFGNSENKDAHITWTDGTAAAPAKMKDFHWAADSIAVPVPLTEGKFAVTFYLTGWNCGYLLAVYDKNGHFINAYQGADEWAQNSHTAKIVVTLDVKEEGEYTFKVMKCRGTGNFGWAAIAVSQDTPYSLEKKDFDITKGGSTVHKIVILKDGEACSDSATYQTSADGVVTVETDGTLTAVGAGTAVVTVTVGGTKLHANVTVTEYTLEGGNSITLPNGGTANIHITANPQREFTATYLSGSDTVAEVDESGLITAKGEGETDVTITIGDLTLTLHVKVVSYRLNKSTIVVTLGEETEETLVMQDGEGTPAEGVTFESDDDQIVAIDPQTGKITFKTFGKTTLRAKLKEHNITLECQVTVKLNVGTDKTKDYTDDSSSVILDEVDETNVTLDWRYFGRDGFRESMKNGALITDAEINGDADFYDYRAKINWLNGTTIEQYLMNRRDGVVFRGNGKQGVSFDVKVTKDVQYIAIFTGAWHAKNTVTISYQGEVYATYEFDNKGNSDSNDKCKQVIFAPDMQHFGTEEKTFTITLAVGEESDNGWTDNVSLVAVAVVGTAARGAKTAAATGSLTATPFSDLGGEEVIDLTAAGSLDWVYAKNGNDGGRVRKNTQSHAILDEQIITSGGDGYDYIGVKKFHWTDGTQEAASDKLDNFMWINEAYQVPVHLAAGQYDVTLYLSGWKNSYFVTAYDGLGNTIIERQRVMEGDGGSSKQAAVKVTLNVTAESNFVFLMTKEGDGNHGWAAVTVASVG